MMGITYREAGDLLAALDCMGLAGKTVEAIGISGGLSLFGREHMINLYNNLVAMETGRFRRTWEPIYEDELPRDATVTRMVSTESPVVVSFTDGTTLEVAATDFGVFDVRSGVMGETPVNSEVDATRILRPVIGETVNSVEVLEPGDDSQWRELALEHGGINPPKAILLRCERHMLYLSYTTCAVLLNEDVLNPVGMTIGELRDAIAFWDEQFDSRP